MDKLKMKNLAINDFKINEKDTGSTTVQILYLTTRINEINEHLRQNPKDNASQLGLLKLVGKRKRLTKYLMKNNPSLYEKVIKAANLRK